MSEYTPTAADIDYEIQSAATSFDVMMTEEGFKAAIAAHDEQVRAAAWDEGRKAAVDDNLRWNYVNADAPETKNPYRTPAPAEQKESKSDE